MLSIIKKYVFKIASVYDTYESTNNPIDAVAVSPNESTSTF